MPTRFENALNNLVAGKRVDQSLQYLQDMRDSHEALLKAAKRYANAVLDDRGALGLELKALSELSEAIRQAEEISR